MTAKKRKTVRSKRASAKSARSSKQAPQATKRKPEESKTHPSKSGTKRTLIKGLLERPDGASISELMQATGWQDHSVRAALTGLRHDNYTITRTKADGGPSRFRIVAS